MEKKLRSMWSESRELSLGSGPSIPHLPSAPSTLEFLRDFVSPNIPCLISSPFSSSPPPPALSLWPSDSYLCTALNNSPPISLHVTPTGHADSLTPHPHLPPPSLCFASPAIISSPISTALDLISSSSSSSPIYYAQHQNNSLLSQFSPISHDVPSHVPFATPAFSGAPPDAVNLWIGGPRSVTSFHKDHYENLYYVVSGEKHFLLLPPTEVHRLYVRKYPAAVYSYSYREKEKEKEMKLELELEEPERLVPWCSVDPCPETEEEMRRQRREFPRYFQGPEVYSCTVRAGEMLYLPSMWFHYVRQTPHHNGRTIAVNYWYDMKFDIKYAYFNFLQSVEDDDTDLDDSDDDDSEQVDQLVRHCEGLKLANS